MSFFTVELVTPEKVVLKQEADGITLPTPDGEITILPHHIPLVTLISPGEVRLKQGSEELPLAVSKGFLEVRGNLIRLLVDTAEKAEDIDTAKAEAAKKRAEAAMQDKDRLGAEEYALVAAQLERNLARLRVASKYKHRRHTSRQTPLES